MKKLIDKLEKNRNLSKEELTMLVADQSAENLQYLNERAVAVRRSVFGNSVYIRGLIEFTNYCKNDCYYCGLRCSNRKADRYRLTPKQILQCCRKGHELGFRTFVLQGGEDPYWNDERLEVLIGEIKREHPDCALTLSIGERERKSYQRLYDAGADRFLLKHETANADHYGMLHPAEMSHANRLRCLKDLKEIGFQTGCGFMVGSPGQTTETLVEDLMFIREFEPAMVGIGPFIPAGDTPFSGEKTGSVELTLRLLSIIRLMNPKVLLPATTALGTAKEDGRAMGIKAGANVIMPNLSPSDVREKYRIYDNKLATGVEAAEGLKELELEMGKIGYKIEITRGDSPLCINTHKKQTN